MKKHIVLLLFLVIFSGAVAAIEPATLETQTVSGESTSTQEGMNVLITGFRNDKGAARINLFSSDEGFPTEPSKAYMSMMVPIKNRTVEVTFNALPSGEYALSVIHDEKPNGKLMTSWIDIPAEGYGSTSRSRNLFDRPTFWGAAFKYNGKITKVNIKVRY